MNKSNLVHVLWQNNVLLTIYWDNNMFDNQNFPITIILKNLCMSFLLNKNDLSMYSWLIKFVIFSLVFKTSLIIWANDQHCSYYKCYCLMINPNKFIKKFIDFLLYEFKISLQLMKIVRTIVCSILHEYVGVIIFFQCVSLIELNAWENQWLVNIEALQKGKKMNLVDSRIGCKMK
jgi:hypothetical protein